MRWRAQEVDGRLSASNATKIRAALRQSANWQRVFGGYQRTQPAVSNNPTQDRARARAWAMLNINFNNEPLMTALRRTLAEGFALGIISANDAYRQAVELKKAEDPNYIDWKNWKPGNAAAALLVKPTKAFQDLLDGAGVTIRGINSAGYDRLGTALSDAISLGLSSTRAAKLIQDSVSNPARALSIAITEGNRAISRATIERYQGFGVEQVEWTVFDPCPECAVNNGAVVEIGRAFPSGNSQPPVHPNCRCALLPVVPGFNEEMSGVTSTAVPPSIPTVQTTIPNPTAAIEEVVAGARQPNFVPGSWTLADREELREEIVDRIHRMNPRFTREKIVEFVNSPKLNSTDRNLLKSGIIYNNGPVSVRFYGPGAKIAEKKRKELLVLVERLQLSNPKERVSINIGSTSKKKYGWAELGGEQMWITPETVLKDTLAATRQEGAFKMPVLLSNAQRDYTLAHEWGHLIDLGVNPFGGGQSADTSLIIRRLKREFSDSFQSEYSGKNLKEFYAEMFTEWFLSGGKTDNKLVQEMAKEFGWKA
jgi:SPP1 gp7 family putative phage head morphogenesis protein